MPAMRRPPVLKTILTKEARTRLEDIEDSIEDKESQVSSARATLIIDHARKVEVMAHELAIYIFDAPVKKLVPTVLEYLKDIESIIDMIISTGELES